MNRLTLLLALACAVATQPALGATTEFQTETEWMAMMLNDRKSGHMLLEREVHQDQVITRITSSLNLNRAGNNMAIDMTEVSRETRDGRPLGFSARQKISGVEMAVEGTIRDGQTTVTMTGAGSAREQTFPWDESVLMPEALRLRTLQALEEGAEEFEVRVWVPSSLQSVPTTVRLGGEERIEVFGNDYRLQRIDQIMHIGSTPMSATSWTDDALQAKKMSMEMMGMTFTAYACPKECALSANEPNEFFVQMFVDSPRRISRDELTGAVTYQIDLLDDALELTLPESAEQTSRELANGHLAVTVRPLRQDGLTIQASPAMLDDRADYLSASRWLESDDAVIQRLARRARGDAETDLQVMLRLRDFVRSYVSDKNLNVGYASALEVAQNRSGDCTEHALLLAALGRAAGIPTRVATGVAYVDEWLEASNTFVPHAWTQAWVDGQWQSFDAALGQFGSGHIAFSYGDGDPWHFYEGAHAIGQLAIVSVTIDTADQK